jgi:hypothetical protein
MFAGLAVSANMKIIDFVMCGSAVAFMFASIFGVIILTIYIRRNRRDDRRCMECGYPRDGGLACPCGNRW